MSRFIFTYRITPQTTTNTSPAELLMKRKPKSMLDLVSPVNAKQQKQKQYHDIHSKQRELRIGDNVIIHARNSQTWLPATITAITGPLSYVVQLDDSRTQRCRMNQLRARHSNAPQTEINIPGNVFVQTLPDTVTSASSETTPVSPVLNRVSITSTQSCCHGYSRNTPMFTTYSRSSTRKIKSLH